MHFTFFTQRFFKSQLLRNLILALFNALVKFWKLTAARTRY